MCAAERLIIFMQMDVCELCDRSYVFEVGTTKEGGRRVGSGRTAAPEAVGSHARVSARTSWLNASDCSIKGSVLAAATCPLAHAVRPCCRHCYCRCVTILRVTAMSFDTNCRFAAAAALLVTDNQFIVFSWQYAGSTKGVCMQSHASIRRRSGGVDLAQHVGTLRSATCLALRPP